MSERVWAPPPARDGVWAPWRAEIAAALVFLHSDKKGSSGGISGQDWGCSSTCLQPQGWLLLDYRGPTQNMQQVSPGTGMALAVVYHYFLKGVEAGLQITRAKLFHTLHHLERNRTGVPWPQVMWHQWGCGSWMLKILTKMMNLRGRKCQSWYKAVCAAFWEYSLGQLLKLSSCLSPGSDSSAEP